MMRGGNAGQTTTSTTSSGQPDKSGWVVLLGGGLLVVNFVFGSGNATFRYIMGQSSAVPAPVLWAQYALAAVALLVLLGISKTGEAGSNFAVIFLVAVWVLWLLNNQNAVAHLLGQAPNETPGPPAVKDKNPPAVKPPSKPSKGPS